MLISLFFQLFVTSSSLELLYWSMTVMLMLWQLEDAFSWKDAKIVAGRFEGGGVEVEADVKKLLSAE